MALASDLMGLGMPPLLAQEVADAGIGPMTATAAGTTYATSTKLQTAQNIVSVTGATSAVIGIPVVGGDTGALLGDAIIVGNTGTSCLFLFASTGVTISAQGSISSFQKFIPGQTIVVWAISSSSWIGVVG